MNPQLAATYAVNGYCIAYRHKHSYQMDTSRGDVENTGNLRKPSRIRIFRRYLPQSRVGKYNVYIQPLLTRHPIIFFSVHALSTMQWHTPNGVVHTNSTPAEEIITTTRENKLGGVDFEKATSLLGQSTLPYRLSCGVMRHCISKSTFWCGVIRS